MMPPDLALPFSPTCWTTHKAAKMIRVWLLLVSIAAFTPAADSQTVQGGHIGDPVPAPPGVDANGNPAPGCMISFSSPKWPGEGPDFPCAARCEGPNARNMTIENLRDTCIQSGPWTNTDESRHPDFPDRVFAPGFAPEGSTNCWLMTGREDMPNGSHWYPNGHPRCAGVSGEPHLKTFDGVRFDLQAVGEFIAAKSLDDNLEVQMRFEPWPAKPDRLSVATAAAARVGSHRITVITGSDTPLRVDGQPVEIPDGHLRVIQDAGASIVRTGNRYSVVWPDGTNLHVDLVGRHINLYLLPAEARDGRLAGVLGNADGDDGGNDFQTRDGRVLASPPAFETLYRVFANSWRITAETSLFDYEPGESTSTFTRLDVPKSALKISSLPGADRDRAEQRCRAAGVTDADALADCVFDFGFTGDEEFIASALSQQRPPGMMAAIAPADTSIAGKAPRSGVGTTTGAGGVAIEAPSEGIAAHELEVGISGPFRPGYWLGFAPAGSPNHGKAANPYSEAILLAGMERVKLIVPAIPGDYELRYRAARGNLNVELRRPFRSVEPKIMIDAPASAQSGAPIDLKVSGDIGEFMTLFIVPAGSPANAQGPAFALKQGASAADSINLRNTPPGEYEIRCVNDAGVRRQIYARRKLTVR